MNWLQSLSLKWKISIPLLLVCGLFSVSSILGLFLLSNIAKDTHIVGNIFLKQVDYVLQADRDLYQAHLAEFTLVHVDANDAGAHQDYEDNAAQVKERAGKAIALGRLDKPEQYRNEFNTRYADWYQTSSQVIRHVNNNDLAAAKSLSQGASMNAFNTLRDLLDVIQEEQVGKSDFYTNDAVANNALAKTQLIVALIVGVIFSILMIVFVPILIIRTINSVSDSVADIASGDGDLTARIHVQSKDEIGELASRFNQFLDSLHTLISNTKSCATRVADSSTKLTDLSDSNKKALSEQNMALDMVVTAVNEMLSAINEVAQNTSDTAAHASSAKALSNQGLYTVNSAVEKIGLVSQQVESVSELISNVESQVNDVTSVLDVINSIAEQTNLLALNAAIEAARAGEHGRGFAVVADEVRTLASRTQQSTTDIQKMLEQLQNGVAQAVASMKTGTETANATVTVANEAGEALKEINIAVDQIADMATQISTAVEEQSTVVEDINRNLTLINGQAQTTAENADATTVTSVNLNKDSQELMSNVGRFKL